MLSIVYGPMQRSRRSDRGKPSYTCLRGMYSNRSLCLTKYHAYPSDIDLVVSASHLTDLNKSRLLAELARAMRMAYITDVVAIISKARVPIIKFVTNEGRLNVDISLNQMNGISAGKIINQYLDVLPGARPLILVVKAFLSQRSMNEVFTGGIGSYSVICLVISFLQLHPKLRRSELIPELNLGTLLIEFFELYGRNFNYDEVGISIRRGGYYYSKRQRGWLRERQNFLLSIEDPQDKGQLCLIPMPGGTLTVQTTISPVVRLASDRSRRLCPEHMICSKRSSLSGLSKWPGRGQRRIRRNGILQR